MKPLSRKIVLVFLLCFVFPYSVVALGVGECHSPVNIHNPLVKWSYPSGEVHWSKLEPQKDQYNFKNIDDFLNKVKRQGKKAVLQVLVSNPPSPDQNPTVPQWAIDEGMHVVNRGIPIQWDPIYLERHEKILKAIAERYEKPEYYETIEAVLIQGGGNYGEMTVSRSHCYGEQNADVMDPSNIYVREMARVFLGSEERASELTKVENGKIVFDTYFIKALQNIIDIYARSFKRYPFVIQTGNGLSCQARVSKEVLEYGVSKYGNRFWLKNNGLGTFTGLGEGSDSDRFFTPYKGKTVIGYEIGHPSYWCASEGGKYPKGINMSTGACKWDTREEAITHNNFALQFALNSGASHICFQHVFFEDREKYPFDMSALQEKLEKNSDASLFFISSVNSSSSRFESSSSISSVQSISYDVNTDGTVSLVDYYYVLLGLQRALLPNSIRIDVTNDGVISELDIRAIINVIRQRYD